MPDPRATQNLLMPHPRDWQGRQMFRSGPGEGAGRSWICLMHKHTQKNLANIQPPWPHAWSIIHVCRFTSLPSFGISDLPTFLAAGPVYSPAPGFILFHKQQVEIFNFCFQGVLKVRKRVTLMVITVSIIFGVTWLADSFNFVLHFYKPSFNKLTFAATSIFVLFNSAINPILYALINQRFKEKMKGILSGKCRAEPEGMFSVKKHEKVEIAVISFHQLTDERSWGSDFW